MKQMNKPLYAVVQGHGSRWLLWQPNINS